MATLKSIHGPLVRTPILVGFVEKVGGAPGILEGHLVHEHTEYREELELSWLGLAGGVATACSNTDILVPLGSLL